MTMKMQSRAAMSVNALIKRLPRKALAVAAPGHGGAGAYILTGRGVEQSSHGTDTVTAAIDLLMCIRVLLSLSLSS